MKVLLVLLVVILCGCLPKEEESYKVQRKAMPFSLNEVRLLPGPFNDAMEANKRWLLNLSPDRLLYRYRVSSGLSPKDSSYTGWEIRYSGHSLGHYLSACAMMYASTEDKRFEDRVNYIVNELDTCQLASGNGYVGGVNNAREVFLRISKGDIELVYGGFKLNGVWVPWYNQHKIFAGLIDAYVHAKNKKAKEIIVKLSDWTYKLISNLSEEQMQEMLVSEHGGMNESLAEVYRITGDKRYLDLSKRFNHNTIMKPLSQGIDDFDGRHANSQIPKVIGALRQFEMGDDLVSFNIADFFWNTMVNHHSYVIGGNGESEYLGSPDSLSHRLTDFTSENCGTYNMLKLTKQLYCLNPTVDKIDYYERALFNQILASQDPETGTVSYFSGLAAESSRNYCSTDKTFWCCTGSGFENHSKYGESIYFKDNSGGLYVNLFIPSELNWEDKGVSVTQTTEFPFSDKMEYVFKIKRGKKKFAVKLRYPKWAEGASILINDKPFRFDAKKSEYINIDRVWKNGDRVILTLPMKIHSEQIHGDESISAYLYGPIVLAYDMGRGVNKKVIPVVISRDWNDYEGLFSYEEKESLSFNLRSFPKEVTLTPYYLTGRNSTTVYFKHHKPEDFNYKVDLPRSRFKNENLDAHVTDVVKTGMRKSMKRHSIQGKNLEYGVFANKNYVTSKNGYFSFEMEVNKDTPMGLVCVYNGELSEISNFDIFIDEEFLVNEKLEHKEDELLSVYYNIWADYTLGKEKVVVTFKANANSSTIGPLFECRMVEQLK